jgi:hypothetical protein
MHDEVEVRITQPLFFVGACLCGSTACRRAACRGAAMVTSGERLSSGCDIDAANMHRPIASACRPGTRIRQ